MKHILPLSLLTAALLSQANASENQYTLQSISLSASQGTKIEKKDVTDSVTIITKEAIEESRVTTLAEALSQLGNMAITQSGGMGQQTSMFLRGVDTGRILVLIDGIRYNNPTTPNAGAELAEVMLYNVEHIEIIKGAQSGVWGSDATGGVINIVTSKAQNGLHANLNVEYGSFDTKKTSLASSYATDKYDVLVTGLYLGTDGFSAYEPNVADANYGKRYDELGLEKDTYTNRSLNAKLGYNITQEDRVEASMQQINSEVAFDDFGADNNVPQTQTTNSFYTLGYKHSGALHSINASYSLSDFQRESTFSFAPASPYLYEGSVNEFKIDDKIAYAEDSFLRVGVSHQEFSQKEITQDTNKNYNAVALFVTNYNKFALLADLDTIATESIRYDKYDAFDDALTGKLGLKQFVFENYFLSTNIGTGYKAPTLEQLYGQWGANPSLKPEKSLSTDITLGSDTLWFTAFYNEITDLIDWTGAWPNAGYNQVAGKSKFHGYEIGYQEYLFDTLGVGANYTYVKTKDADGKELARRPESQLDLRATYYLSAAFDLGANAQYIGSRYDSADKQGAQTGYYTVVNLVSNVKVNDFVTLYGKINNITDEYYQMVDGYATAGRSLLLGLNAKY